MNCIVYVLTYMQLVESVTDLTHHEKTVVEALDKEIEQHEVRKRKRKKPHGPNPLSVKKKAKSHAPVLTAKTSSKNQVCVFKWLS